MIYELIFSRQAKEDLSKLKKSELVYEIHEEKIDVFILSSYGHYDDR